MQNGSFIIHSEGASAVTQMIYPGSSVLLDAGGNPRVREDASDAYNNVPYNSMQPELLRRGVPLALGLYEPSQPGHPTGIMSLLRILETSLETAQLRIVRDSLQWQHNNNISITEIAVSHPHLDSTSALPMIRAEIPTIMSQETVAYLSALGQLLRSPSRRMLEVRRPDEDGKLDYEPRSFISLEYDDPYTLNGLNNILLSQVDHILGSSAISLSSPDGTRIVYTSDIGPGRHTDSFLREIQGPDILFLDSTNLGQPETTTMSPIEFQTRLMQTLKIHGKKNIFVKVPRHDLTRLGLVAKASRQAGRELILPWQLAGFNGLSEEALEGSGVDYQGIYLTPRETGTYTAFDYPLSIRFQLFDRTHAIYSPQELVTHSAIQPTVTIIEGSEQFKHIDPAHLPRERSEKSRLMINAGYPLSKSEAQGLLQMCRKSNMDLIRLENGVHLSHDQLMSYLSNIAAGLIVPLHTLNPRAASAAIEDSGFKGKVLNNIVRNWPYDYNGRRLNI